MECLSSKWIKTRKPHRCWGCWHVYPPKTQMLVTVTVDGGDILRSYLCPYCEKQTEQWDSADFESVGEGEIGYWKNDSWHSIGDDD